ncbi:MAG: hypothetical protein HPY75_02590 [Actinobacteria bacterium]|nr:hypothetical protein [Actinomycetota bacterium]
MLRLETRSRIVFILAALVLAAGAVSSLLIRAARSSSTREVMDVTAAGETALGIYYNVSSLADRWREPGSNDMAALAIAMQECIALLRGEMDHARELEESILSAGDDETRRGASIVLEALALLREAQEELAGALGDAGEALGGLYPLREAENRYKEARDAFLGAVSAHNQAVEASSRDFSSARQRAASSILALEKARAAVDSAAVEGLNLDPARSAIADLDKAVGEFIQACALGESGDVAAHNELVALAEASLASAPATLEEGLDVSGWLAGLLAPRLDEVKGKLSEARDLIGGGG